MSRAAELRLLERTGTLFAQLFFIAAGVYLGNRADAWKEERGHREAARAAVQNFRTEMAANRDAVKFHAAIHARYSDSMRVSQARGDAAPKSVREAMRRLGWAGTAPTTFGHTGWDLALATQALSYLPPALAFDVARVYTLQERTDGIQRDASTALFNPAGMGDAQIYAWLTSFGGYVGDMGYAEPALLRAYDRMLPRLDSAAVAFSR